MAQPGEPYVEFEVTVRVHAAKSEPEPKNWSWPELTDMNPDDIQFVSQRVVREYDRELDADDPELMPPEARAYWRTKGKEPGNA